MREYLYQDGLESDRLHTRYVTKEDINMFAEFFENPEALLFMPTFGLDNNIDIANKWIEIIIDRCRNKEYGFQALIDKNTNQFVGICGLLAQCVDDVAEVEVGYHILSKYWGQGYAPEAARIFFSYAFDNDITDSVISIIDTKNTKSQRVAEKNGLVREKQTRWGDLDVYIYRINKKDWK